MYAKLADLIAALLEPFLNDNPGALDRSARIFDDGDQSHKGTAIGKEIIDNENVIFRPQKLLERITSYVRLCVKDSTLE